MLIQMVVKVVTDTLQLVVTRVQALIRNPALASWFEYEHNGPECVVEVVGADLNPPANQFDLFSKPDCYVTVKHHRCERSTQIEGNSFRPRYLWSAKMPWVKKQGFIFYVWENNVVQEDDIVGRAYISPEDVAKMIASNEPKLLSIGDGIGKIKVQISLMPLYLTSEGKEAKELDDKPDPHLKRLLPEPEKAPERNLLLQSPRAFMKKLSFKGMIKTDELRDESAALEAPSIVASRDNADTKKMRPPKALLRSSLLPFKENKSGKDVKSAADHPSSANLTTCRKDDLEEITSVATTNDNSVIISRGGIHQILSPPHVVKRLSLFPFKITNSIRDLGIKTMAELPTGVIRRDSDISNAGDKVQKSDGVNATYIMGKDNLETVRAISVGGNTSSSSSAVDEPMIRTGTSKMAATLIKDDLEINSADNEMTPLLAGRLYSETSAVNEPIAGKGTTNITQKEIENDLEIDSIVGETSQLSLSEADSIYDDDDDDDDNDDDISFGDESYDRESIAVKMIKKDDVQDNIYEEDDRIFDC
uniref:C2 domain-containing protein n=1 Tax=Chaetoceros debilis TaxID=122233 RepID=A0A7S3VDJ6_9STRA|mmetsp:Transcript_11795/g.17876  ORF Transcript_11795/g.17876 Transcript_11795/m.17876 type:complete len:533 (+) Transcript_11795:118-1716(+)|eukprot:CAMPEP_0194110864 /NCGR_PEP_ID=MMETSP0150-20130528/10016_1 /TAXON_ID=122233 /ORGANISM="Chaetoceros debilis, Strain MM31A-1" /LENGTH=532 /DNA_ID=CAMNT_0038800151 /DNA_START=87 /DNA_END=1685 /DNA_ORIENTATION=-